MEGSFLDELNGGVSAGSANTDGDAVLDELNGGGASRQPYSDDSGQVAQPRSDGRTLGFYERHGLTAQQDTGFAPSEAYDGDAAGDAANFLYNATPFARTFAKANEGSVRDALANTAKTGTVPAIDIIKDFKGSGALQDEERNWLDTEGRKYDLYAKLERGETGVDYSPIMAKRRDAKGRMVADTDERGNPYADERYAGGEEAKEAARAAHMREFAAEWLKQTDEGRRSAQSELKGDTAAWYRRLATDATTSLGYWMELYMGGRAMDAAMAAGALGATAKGLATATSLGWKGKTALGAAEITIPSLMNAAARYEQLTADDVSVDGNGNIKLREGDGFVRASIKSLMGAYAENAVEVALGAATEKLLGGAIRATGSTKVAQKLLGKVPSAVTQKARDLWLATTKNYAKVRNAVKMDLPAGEFAEEYAQGMLDDVIGLGKKASEESEGFSDFTKEFFDWDANLKDLTYGIIGQTLLFGGVAHGANRYRINRMSFDSRVTGALKERGFLSWEQFMMGADKRLAAGALANTQREYNADGTVAKVRNRLLEDKEFGASFRDILSLCGISDKRIDGMSNAEQYAALDAVNAVMTNPDGAEGVLADMNRGMRRILNRMEMKSMLDGNWKNVQAANERESRVRWSGTVDRNGNVEWIDDGANGSYVEDTVTGARIYRTETKRRDGTTEFGYTAFHPELGYAQPAPTMEDAANWVSDMDKAVQERNDIREKKREYAENFVRRLVPERTDGKTGQRYGANVVVVNNADDAAVSSAVPEADRNGFKSLSDDEKTNEAFISQRTGIVYVFADNIMSVDHMAYTLVHELGYHAAPQAEANAQAAKDGGTDEEMATRGKSLMDEIVNAVYPKSQNAAEDKAEIERTERGGDESAERIAREEALAYGNEMRTPNAGAVRRAITAVKMFVARNFGTELNLTDADYEAIATAGLRKIRRTVGFVAARAEASKGYADAPRMPFAFNINSAEEGKSLLQAEMDARWVSDFARQQDALEAARMQNQAARDKAEADALHAREKAREDARIAGTEAVLDEVQRKRKEAAVQAQDAEFATVADRSGVADILKDWNADDPETNEIVANGATDEEIETVLDAVEAEMGGEEDALAVVLAEVRKSVERRREKRRKSEAARKRMEKNGNPSVKKKADRDRNERKLLTKFVNDVQLNPNSMLAFWLRGGKKLLTQPVTLIRTKYKTKGLRKTLAGRGIEFASANGLDAEALNLFFDGMKGKERAKWMRIVFGEDYANASEDGKSGQSDTGADTRNQEWIAFKNGIAVNDNERQMADDDYNDFSAMLNRLRKEYEAYEKWKAGDRLTAYEQKLRDEIDAENARIDAENAAIAEAEEAWGGAIAVSADGKPISDASQIKAGDFAKVGEMLLTVARRDGDLIQFDTEGNPLMEEDELTYRWNKEKGNWEYAKPAKDGKGADEGGRGGGEAEDTGNAEPQADDGDDGAAGGEGGRNGAAAEAPSDYSKVEGLTDAQKEKVASYTKSIGGNVPPIIDPITIRDLRINDEGTVSFVFLAKHYKGKEPGIEEAFSVQYISEDGFSWTDTYRGDGRIVGRNGHASGNPQFEKLIADGVISRKTVNEIAQAPSAGTEGGGLNGVGGTPKKPNVKPKKSVVPKKKSVVQKKKSIIPKSSPAPKKSVSGSGEVRDDGIYIAQDDDDGGKWRRANGISKAAHRSLGPDFDRLLAIAQSNDTPQGKWRRAKEAGYGTRTMDEYIASVRAEAEKKANEIEGRWRRSAITPAEDAAYMDAVKRGDMETCARMVREAAAKAGYVYSRFTRSEKPYNDVPWMMFAKDENGDALNNNGYGSYLYLANDAKAIDVENIYKELQSVARELYGKELTEDELNPKNIVDSATWMDDMDFVQKLWDDHLNELYEKSGEVPAIRTADGLFVLGEDNHRIKSADPVTYDDAGNIIPLSERFNADNDDIRWRRAYKPDPDAQALADIAALSQLLNPTDHMTEADRLAVSRQPQGNAVLMRTEKMMRELAQQGSISPELRDILNRARSGTAKSKMKGATAAMFSPRALSVVRERLQDSNIALREMENALGLNKADSAYYQFDRNFGMVEKAMIDLDNEILRPLGETMRRNGIGADDLNMYLLALHGAERNRMIAERSPYVLAALADERTAPMVKSIIAGTNGTRDLNKTDIDNICTLLGWMRNGKRTKEGLRLERDLMGSGGTTAFWNEKIADFNKVGGDGRSFADKAKDAVDLVRELTRRNRQLLVDTGRLSSAQRDMWESMSPNYVPMRSDLDMDADMWSRAFLSLGRGEEPKGGRRYSDAEYNHAFGRGTIADDPLSFSIQQYEESLGRAWDNVARRKLADAVRANPKLGKVFVYMPQSERADIAKRIAILNNVAKTRPLTAAENDALAKMTKRLSEANNTQGSIPTVKVFGANGVMHETPSLSAIEGTKDKPTGIIAFKEDGDLKFIRLGGFSQAEVDADPSLMNDVDAKRIATAVKRQNMARLNGVMQLMRAATGYFSALRTAFSPTFVVSNLGADNTQAARNIGATFGLKAVGTFEHYAYGAFGAAKAVLHGRNNGTKLQNYAEEWAKNGGMIGGLAVENINDLRKRTDGLIRRLASQSDQLAKVKDVRSFLTWAKDRGADFADLAQSLNSIVEMSTRIAAYATARDNGMDVADAVSYARDITVNFNRKGTETPWINALYAFSNATMQDIHRSLVAFAEGNYAKGSGILAKRGAVMGVGLAFLGFVSALLGYMQDDPDDEKQGKAQYKYAKEYQKQNVFGVRIGGKTVGVPIRGLSRIPYYLGHQVYEAMFGHKGVASLAGDTLALAVENMTDFLGTSATAWNTLTPSVLRPGTEIAINKTFTDRKMYRDPMPGMKETAVLSEMGRGDTSDAAKAVARFLNWATLGDKGKPGVIDMQPEKIAAVWNWIFGSAGKDVANIAGFAIDAVNGKLWKGERSVRNIPYLSRFVRNLDENSADFYKARARYEQAKEHMKAMEENGDERAMRKDADEHPWLSQRGAGKRWGKQLRDLDGSVKKLLEMEKGLEGDEYRAIHQLRMKAQYQFMRRLDNAPSGDAEGVADEAELRRSVIPMLRSKKNADRREEAERKRKRRALGM